jgi:hypothetical protein
MLRIQAIDEEIRSCTIWAKVAAEEGVIAEERRACQILRLEEVSGDNLYVSSF